MIAYGVYRKSINSKTGESHTELLNRHSLYVLESDAQADMARRNSKPPDGILYIYRGMMIDVAEETEAAAYRARLQGGNVQTQVLHLCPAYKTNPSLMSGPIYWDRCENRYDCSRWEHKTQSRIIYEPTPWVDVKEEN